MQQCDLTVCGNAIEPVAEIRWDPFAIRSSGDYDRTSRLEEGRDTTTVQFVAHISQEGPQRSQSFWEDIQQTDDWLTTLGKEVTGRRLTIRARSLRQVSPWVPEINQPLRLEGWLTPMSVDLTWRYLVKFLVEQGPDHLLIPLEGDAHVGWDGHLLTIQAPRQSWIWRTIEELWDPFSWSPIDMEEWWEGHAPYLAQRYGWGFMSQTTPRPFWEEWQLGANRGHEGVLQNLFTTLVAQMGARRVRVRWHQETLPQAELLLGLPIRLREITMDIVNPRPVLWQRHRIGLAGLKSHMAWEIPHWNKQFANTLILRRWRHDSRLEAHYRLTNPIAGHEDSLRAFRQERHVLPIFRWYPVQKTLISHSWQGTVERARTYQRLDQLATYLSARPWPVLRLNEKFPARLRFDHSVWHQDPIRSQPGTWVYVHRAGPEIILAWPQHEHPGHIAIQWSGSLSAQGLEILDPLRTVASATKNWRYWAWLVTAHVMPTIEEWVRDQR